MRYLVPVILFVVITQTGCGNYKALNQSSERGCSGTDCTVIANRFKATAGLVKQNQLFSALQGCLKLPDANISAETKSVFQSIRLSLSAEGTISDVNAPMMMAVTQLAGEMCNDEINFEVSTKQKIFFGAFDNIYPATQGGTTVISDPGAGGSKPTLKSTIAKLAKSCWGRDAMQFEIDKINEQFTKSSVGSRLDKSAALFLCTLTLSSTDILIY